MNKENRKLMKELEIQSMRKPLGRPPKQSKTEECQLRMAKAAGERNEIEAILDIGKRIYKANNIGAKLAQTANYWTAMRNFVKNIMKFQREFLHVSFFILELMTNPCNNPKRILTVQGFAC